MVSAAVVHVDQGENAEVVVGMCAKGNEVVDMGDVQVSAAAQVRMGHLIVASGDLAKTRRHPQPCPTAVVYPCSTSALLGWGFVPSEIAPADLNVL